VNFDEDFAQARIVADAVLYEGYVLYPYRASAQKNRSRWQFGVVMPAAYAAKDESERSFSQAECVVEGGGALTVLLRFLQVQQRTVQRWTGEEFVPADGVLPWDEAVAREITVTATDLPYVHTFHVDGGTDTEAVPDGRVVRTRRPLSGVVSVSADPLPGPWHARRLRIRVENRTPAEATDRAGALSAALVASHTIVGVVDGAFVSMVDGPEWAAEAVAGCVNTGTWPVLAGPPGRRDLMLCAPIILYDHPQIAPESPGDLFDATEIDEILTLRTLALSDAEKQEARATDPRAAALIDRVEALDADQMARLHGTIRTLRPVPAIGPDPGAGPAAGAWPPSIARPAPAFSGAAPRPADDVPWWDPGADASVSPHTDTVLVDGHALASGSRVRLRPGARRADAQDMFLVGRLATVEAVLLDVDDNPYLAVTLFDDPGADLQRSHGRFLYFAPDELEPVP
jgi:hypothetical protein